MARAARRHPLWSVALLAFVARGAYVLVTRPDPLSGVDPLEFVILARDITEGRGIVEYQGTIRPPLYPLFVAASYALGGAVVLQIAQILVGAATVPLVGILARLLRPERGVGVAAALIAALYPWSFQYVGVLASETLFTLLAVAAFAVVLVASGRSAWRPALAAGLVTGAAILARSNMIILVPTFATWWWWRRRRLAGPALFLAGVVLALAPFSVYNWSRGNGLFVASSGQVFYVGNGPSATAIYGGDLSDDAWRAEIHSGAISPRGLAYLGCSLEALADRPCEHVPFAERDRFFYEGAFRYIRTHTAEWALTEVRKFLHFWRPWVDPRVYSLPAVLVSGASFSLVLLLAAAGVRGMRRPEAVFVLLVAAAATFMAVGWFAALRYRFALLDPVLIAAAGAPAAALLARVVGLLRPGLASGAAAGTPTAQGEGGA